MKKSFSLRIYGEGGKDEKFWKKFCSSENFEFHHEKWAIGSDGHSSGGSPIQIIEDFIKSSQGTFYHLALIFCDVDKIGDTKKTQKEIEDIYWYRNIRIVWQDSNFEKEVEKLDERMKKNTKEQINKWACKNVVKFINGKLDKKIKKIIKDKEKDL